MKVLRLGDSDLSVLFLKNVLNRIGYTTDTSFDFDEYTHKIVTQFQKTHGLFIDGIVGRLTWKRLLLKGYNFSWGATTFTLNDDEWINQYTEKDTIFLHHTAGFHRPDFTIGWWDRDNKPGKLNRVATSFVIGRRALDGTSKYDGVTLRAFNEIFWAHHLGTKLRNNKLLNQKSIGIEICSLGGPLLKSVQGDFYFEANGKKTVVPTSEVCELETPWRGHTYFQKYTDKQIKECERLILTLSSIFNIPLRQFQYNTEWFDVNKYAMDGIPGLWTMPMYVPIKPIAFPPNLN